ncbi:MAG: type II secretion system minor pseudopilin GspI [Pseudomonadota bacterium]
MEVLVAVAVLAIALVASLRLISQQTRFASALETRVFAHWVAANALEERRLGLTQGFGGDTVEMAGITWRIDSSDSAGPVGLTRTEVRVRGEDGTGAVLIGYLRPRARAQ